MKEDRPQINLRLKPAEYALWREAAAPKGLSAWLRTIANKQARREIAGKVRKSELHKV